jgi:tetratricopeptide (TPR) repeat protein
MGAGLAVVLSPALAWAQTATPAKPAASQPGFTNSPLDAALFYQLLVGELELRNGAPGTAFEVLLDAARKQRNEQLFRRASDIALQARAGEQALSAAKAWRTALPGSVEAHRYVIQLLVALGKPMETAEPLESLIRLTPPDERPVLISALPRFFASTSDRKQVPVLLERVLAPHQGTAASRLATLQALATSWLMAQSPDKALALAQEGQALDPKAQWPALLGLQLLQTAPGADALVRDHLQLEPGATAVRIGYARALSANQRYMDAIAQLEEVTRREPERSSPWLTLGALQLELRKADAATQSLQTFLRLVAEPATPAPPASADADQEDELTSTEQARVQAWLMLAQAAELRGDFKGAEAWLARADNPQRALEVQQRRASLLAKQGRMAEARALIRQLPDKEPEAARAKLFAEAQLLRDAKLWKEAGEVLAKASERFPADIDVMYEQSMIAEKLNRLDEMERLLRRVIEIKPDHHHAHNALGYSFADRNVRLPEAKQLIERALQLAPGDPFITDSLGWVEYRLGNYAEAIRLLRQAYQARPDTEIGAHLGEVLWVSGQTEEARRIWREARGRDAANDVLRETLARLRANL